MSKNNPNDNLDQYRAFGMSLLQLMGTVALIGLALGGVLTWLAHVFQ